jgi:hypothetical protein
MFVYINCFVIFKYFIITFKFEFIGHFAKFSLSVIIKILEFITNEFNFNYFICMSMFEFIYLICINFIIFINYIFVSISPFIPIFISISIFMIIFIFIYLVILIN